MYYEQKYTWYTYLEEFHLFFIFFFNIEERKERTGAGGRKKDSLGSHIAPIRREQHDCLFSCER